MLRAMRLGVSYLVSLSLLGLGACSARPPAESPATQSVEGSPKEEPGPERVLVSPEEPGEGSARDSVLALEGELIAAEQQLSAALPGSPQPSALGSESEDAVANRTADTDDEAPAPVAPARARATQSPEAPAKAERGKPTCEVACRAWASMSRASDRICELDGPDGGRCSDAKLRVSRAKSRLDNAACTCPVD